MAGTLLHAANLRLTFGSRTVFEDLTLTVEEGERVGLVGINGSGKSSLMKMLARELVPDSGELMLRRGARVEYLPQEPTFPEGATIESELTVSDPELKAALAEHAALSAQGHETDAHLTKLSNLAERIERLGGWDTSHRARALLERLGVLGWDQPVAELSGGTRKRVAIARTLLRKPDLLLLDEPTNHLDADTIDWLEEALDEFEGALVLVTHDRYFLDDLVDRIVEIQPGAGVTSYPGNYEAYLLQKIEADENAAVAQHKRERWISQEVAWLRRGVEARRTKSKARIQRAQKLMAERGWAQTKVAGLQIAAAPRLGQREANVYSRPPFWKRPSWNRTLSSECQLSCWCSRFSALTRLSPKSIVRAGETGATMGRLISGCFVVMMQRVYSLAPLALPKRHHHDKRRAGLPDNIEGLRLSPSAGFMPDSNSSAAPRSTIRTPGLICVALISLLRPEHALAFSDAKGAPGYKVTPAGIIHESCIRQVPNGAHVHQDGTVADRYGSVLWRDEPCAYPVLGGRVANASYGENPAEGYEMWRKAAFGESVQTYDAGTSTSALSRTSEVYSSPPLDAGYSQASSSGPVGTAGPQYGQGDAGPLGDAGICDWMAWVFANIDGGIVSELTAFMIVPPRPKFPDDGGQKFSIWPGIWFLGGNGDLLQPLVNFGVSSNNDFATACPGGDAGLTCYQTNAEVFPVSTRILYVTPAYLANPGDYIEMLSKISVVDGGSVEWFLYAMDADAGTSAFASVEEPYPNGSVTAVNAITLESLEGSPCITDCRMLPNTTQLQTTNVSVAVGIGPGNFTEINNPGWQLGGNNGNPIGYSGEQLDCNQSESFWADSGPWGYGNWTANINIVNCIPGGSPMPEAPSLDDCCNTVNGGVVSPNSGVCCNTAPFPCGAQNDCCGGNVCSNGYCAIDDGQGYCSANGYNTNCLSTVCDAGVNECICFANGVNVGGNWWECCSGTAAGSSCSTNLFLGDGGCVVNTSRGCDTISQICDWSQGGTCRITSVGSAYEKCTKSSDCEQAPVAMNCTTTGQCCNGIDGGCVTDKDCCDYESCTAIGGSIGVCKVVSGPTMYCTDSTQCLYGACSGNHCL